jgi:myosin-1
VAQKLPGANSVQSPSIAASAPPATASASQYKGPASAPRIPGAAAAATPRAPPAPPLRASVPPPPPPAPDVPQYKALYNFDTQEEGEMVLVKDETVEVTQKDDNGWWLVKKNGVEGWAPSNYVSRS